MTEREKIIELAKGCGAVSEPVAWLQTSVEDGVDTVIARTYKPDKFNAEWWRFDPLYLHPLPQPDLVAENELLKADLENERMRLAACGVAALGYFDGCNDEYKSASLSDTLRLYAANNELRRQLATAQASEGELLKSLEKINEDAKDTCLASVRHLGRIANGAITAHKARKE